MDEACDECMDIVLKKVRGLACVINRKRGWLGSQPNDAESLEVEGRKGCTLIATFEQVPIHNELYIEQKEKVRFRFP